MNDTQNRQDSFAGPLEGEYVLSLRDLFRVVWRRLWIIVLVAIVFGGAAVGYSISQVPIYQATQQMLVGQSGGISQTPGDTLALQQLTQTMSTAANSQLVAENVAEQLDLEEDPASLLAGLEVEPVPETQFIELSYYDTDPERARRIVSAFGEAFSEEISEVSPDASGITARPWGEASASAGPVSPDPVRNALFAIVLGGFLGLGLVFLLEYLDDSWGSPEEAEEVSGVPTFGVIPQFAPSTARKKKALPAGKAAGKKAPARAYASNRVAGFAGTRKARYQEIARDESVVWPFGFALLDADGKIEDANSALRRMLGYEAGELRGAVFAEFASHPDDVESHAKMHRELMDGERDHYQLEKRCIKKDGQLMWVCLTVSPGQDPDGEIRFAIATVEDITSRKQAEESLQLSKEERRLSKTRLRTMIDQSPLIIQVFTQDGYSLMTNSAWDEFWGRKEEDTGSLNVFEDAAVREAGLTPYIEKSVSDGDDVRTPSLFYQPAENGHKKDACWIRASVHPVRDEAERVIEVMLVIEDVTEYRRAEEISEKSAAEMSRMKESLERNVAERERAEAALKESREKFRSLVRYVSGDPTDNEGKGR